MTNKKYNTVEKSVTISLEKLSIYVRDVTNESHWLAAGDNVAQVFFQ